MKNKLTSQQDLINTILCAVYAGNGKAAEEAAQKINEEFILIRKSDLPAVVPKTLPLSGKTMPKARTVGYHGYKPEIYWDRALDYISVALHAENEEVKEAEKKLDKMREEAHAKLFPFCNYNWTYAGADPHDKRKVDVVVDLMTQVDELKEAK